MQRARIGRSDDDDGHQPLALDLPRRMHATTTLRARVIVASRVDGFAAGNAHPFRNGGYHS